jgi:4-hydroxyphenylacetate 3-monooxygenase
LVFLVPTNAPGVKFICRVSNEPRAAVLGSPFDYPLSSRLDENDAIFIMDEVFVPWENIFVYGDLEKANTFFVSGFVLPNHNAGAAYHVLAPDAYVQIKHQIEKTVASSLIYLNSHARDFTVPELRKYLDLYVRGSGGVSAVERVKLMKLLWDSIGTEFGARHELYEVNYSGSHEEIRRFAILGANASGQAAQWKAFADQCMAEYDIDGWTVPDLVNPDDVSVLSQK